jgi:hypothetical protein
MLSEDISLVRTVNGHNHTVTIIGIADYVTSFCYLAGSELAHFCNAYIPMICITIDLPICHVFELTQILLACTP